MLNRKLIALMMTGVLVFGGSFSVMAAEAVEQSETEAETYIEYDITCMDKEYEANAQWYNLFDAFNLCIPSDWEITRYSDLDDESIDDYIYFEAVNADENESVKVSFDDSYDFSDTQELADYMIEGEVFSEYEMAIVNDIECVAFIGTDDDENNLKGIATLTSDGGVFLITCVCSSDEVTDEFDSISNNIMVSFSLPEEETQD